MSGASSTTRPSARTSIVASSTLIVMMLSPTASLSVTVWAASSRDTISPKSERRIFRVWVGGIAFSDNGASPVAHQQPVHTGREGSPASNSIHTPAPIMGTMNIPAPTPA